VFTHAPEQLVSPLAHSAWQWPLEHTWLCGQAVPHAPQCLGSLASSTHWPEHMLWPDGQAHLPPAQCCPAGQWWPQAPQW
jgi:hypothetical protein